MDYDILKQVNNETVIEESPKTTKDNPLVFVWDSEKSVDYPEQGIVGHMHLGTAAKIEGFNPEGLADQLAKAGTGKRVKAGKKWLEYSKWNKKEIKEGLKAAFLKEMEDGDKKDMMSLVDKAAEFIWHMEGYESGVAEDFMKELNKALEQKRKRGKLKEAIERLQKIPGWDIEIDGDEVILIRDSAVKGHMEVGEFMELVKKFNKIQRSRD